MIGAKIFQTAITINLAILPAALWGQASTQPASSQPVGRPVVRFLDLQAARGAIVDDSREPYFKLLQPLEMSAKTGSPITGETLEDMRAECRRRYQENVQEFSASEKEALENVVKALHPILQARYPLFAQIPWSFLKISGQIEGGLSHTRGPLIVLSTGTVAMFTRLENSSPQSRTARIGRVLVHEQMHVFQRNHPELMAKLYTQVWGLKNAEHIESCQWLTEHHVYNPDGVDTSWVFPIGPDKSRRWIWPVLIFEDSQDTPQMPSDLKMVAVGLHAIENGFRIKMQDSSKPDYQPLHAVEKYMRTFAPSRYNFHPNEASADLFSKMVVADAFESGRASKPESGFSKVRDWFEKNLKN